ncbi:hypothetical protein SAMN05444166_4162 [Singulisphaera sp. GP187]|uniref:hypothetical protein n=1 Tax=Singulisphaera sp. GP187 TaxID=1882752 RepID=UPI0009279B64|nr:hypothetical protein [Singulisphaera sp. GP187]SIO37056.1 hypothetical protein SAMN05444166_4162 [Singulisphaera sp. GP187]
MKAQPTLELLAAFIEGYYFAHSLGRTEFILMAEEKGKLPAELFGELLAVALHRKFQLNTRGINE